MAKRDNSVRFVLTDFGFEARDAKGKFLMGVTRSCASHPTDKRKFAIISVVAGGTRIDIMATPTGVRVARGKAHTERKETKR